MNSTTVGLFGTATPLGTVAAMNLKVQALQKITLSDAPNTKKAKEKANSDIRTCGKNAVHSMCIIQAQGWRLQSSIRLIQEQACN